MSRLQELQLRSAWSISIGSIKCIWIGTLRARLSYDSYSLLLVSNLPLGIARNFGRIFWSMHGKTVFRLLVSILRLPERLYEVLPRDMDVHGNAAHRERFIQRMKALGVEAHGPIINDEAALQRMYESQVLWDEYMSESAALWLERNPRGHLCIFAGNGHVEGRVGIPDRLTRRSGRPTFTVVPYTVPFQSDGWPDIPHPGNRDVGDWLWYLPVGSGGAESDESDPKSHAVPSPT